MPTAAYCNVNVRPPVAEVSDSSELVEATQKLLWKTTSKPVFKENK